MDLICNGNLTFECRSCFNDLLPPIFQCPNGHLVCRDCLTTKTNCKVTECKVNTVGHRIRNLELENIISVLKYRCGKTGNGCPTSLNYEEFVGHKLDCPNRVLPFCSLLGIDCDAKLRRPFLIDHLVNDHDSTCFMDYHLGDYLEDHQGTSTLNEPLEWVGPVIQHEQKLFFIRTSFNETSISWMTVLVGSKAEAQKYQVSFQMTSSSLKSEYQWIGLVSGIECNFTNSTNYFSIPKEVFKSYVAIDVDLNQYATWKIKFRINLAPCPSPSLRVTFQNNRRERNDSEILCDATTLHMSVLARYPEVILDSSFSGSEDGQLINTEHAPQ